MDEQTATPLLTYPDISSHQAGINLTGARFIMCKVTQGHTYLNPDYQAERARAQAAGIPFAAYHFLERGNAAGQADWAHSHAGTVPLMVDAETDPATGTGPTIADITQFITRYRELGGKCFLLYLPHWYWAELGSPSLTGIAPGLRLASSNYTAYSDTGPGWEGYGGLTVEVWQFSSNAEFGGKQVDLNAFKGTPAELMAFLTTGPADYQLHIIPTCRLSWLPVPGADHYVIKGNGKVLTRTTHHSVQDLVIPLPCTVTVDAIVHSAPVHVGTLQVP